MEKHHISAAVSKAACHHHTNGTKYHVWFLEEDLEKVKDKGDMYVI